jgi:cellobiose phosphorylase
MYRLIVESLLGLAREGDRLRFTPCLPATWTAFTMRYRYGATTYEIAVRQAQAGENLAATRVMVDGVTQADSSAPLVDDRAEHHVLVEVRAAETQRLADA